MRTDYFAWIGDPGGPGTALVDRGQEQPSSDAADPGDPGDPRTEFTVPGAGRTEIPVALPPPVKSRRPFRVPPLPFLADSGERRAWANDLCLHLTVYVTATLPYMGAWPTLEGFVLGPASRLIEVLEIWEKTGTQADLAEVLAVIQVLLDAWRDAALGGQRRQDGEPCPGCGEACEACVGGGDGIGSAAWARAYSFADAVQFLTS
jgi:hypothetical protein